MAEEGGKKNEFRVSGEDLLKKVKDLIHEGNIRRIIIKDEQGKTYLEIPLLLKMELPLPALAPYLYAGPCMAILLKAETRNTAVSDDWVDVKDDMKSSEWSLAIGGGVRVLKFHADVRYTMGLTELLEQDTTAPATAVLNDSKTRNVSFYVGYQMFSF